MESFLLHEDYVSDFEVVNDILNGRSKAAAASPYIFNISDLSGVNLEGTS